MHPVRYLGALGILAVALAGVPAVAEGGGTTGEASERVICKKQKKTGTRFTSRSCMTAKAWDEMAERARREGKAMIDNASAQAQVRQNGPG